MNKEDNFKEKFKQALVSTVKVISDDYKIDLGSKTKSNETNKLLDLENIISDLENIVDKNQITKLRAETDSEALKRKFSNKKIFEKNNPTNPTCKSLYNLSEKIRYEMLGSTMLKGISSNFQKNYINRLNLINPDKVKKKEDASITNAFEFYLLSKFFDIKLNDAAKKILSYWENDFKDSFDRHIQYLNKNLENQETYNSKFSEILQSMDIFENEDNEEKKENQDNNSENNDNNNKDENESDNTQQKTEDDSVNEGIDGVDDVAEFRLDDQIINDDIENQQSENIVQKKDLSISDKDYKIFTTEFDEIAKAEILENAEEISKLRKNLDQQLTSFQDLITKLANKLQRQLLAKQNRAWEFDLEEGLLDSSKLPRIIIEDRKSTRLNSSHSQQSRMPSSA